MNRVVKIALIALMALALLLGAALAVLAWWLSGDGLRLKLQELAGSRLGVPVLVEKISLDLWPLPSVALQGLVIQTQSPLSAQRVQLRPAWRSLMATPRQLELLALDLQGVQLPQRGLDQVQQSLSKTEQLAQVVRRPVAQNASNPAAQTGVEAPILLGRLTIPARISLSEVTWLSTAGEALTVSGVMAFGAARDALQLDLKLAGGSLRGPLRLAGFGAGRGAGVGADGATGTGASQSGLLQLTGELVASDLDVAALPGLRSRLSGRLQATAVLQAQAAQPSGLGAALQTRTQFSVGGAVIKGIDLARAVTTLGLSRGGNTALSQLSGNLSTRGAGAAMQLSLTELQATSSLLRASGAVNVGTAASAGGPRPLSGKVSVDLNAPDGGTGAGKALGALVGIPLDISGTTAAPTVAPTRGAMIGGAIGSVLAPVIGTGAGAKVGDRVAERLSGLKEKLFGK